MYSSFLWYSWVAVTHTNESYRTCCTIWDWMLLTYQITISWSSSWSLELQHIRQDNEIHKNNIILTLITISRLQSTKYVLNNINTILYHCDIKYGHHNKLKSYSHCMCTFNLHTFYTLYTLELVSCRVKILIHPHTHTHTSHSPDAILFLVSAKYLPTHSFIVTTHTQSVHILHNRR